MQKAPRILVWLLIFLATVGIGWWLLDFVATDNCLDAGGAWRSGECVGARESQ